MTLSNFVPHGWALVDIPRMWVKVQSDSLISNQRDTSHRSANEKLTQVRPAFMSTVLPNLPGDQGRRKPVGRCVHGHRKRLAGLRSPEMNKAAIAGIGSAAALVLM